MKTVKPMMVLLGPNRSERIPAGSCITAYRKK